MKKRVVIIGAGFAGVYTFLKLRPHLKSERLEVILINRSNYFLFTPLLHEAASGGLSPYHTAESLRDIVRGNNADVYIAEAELIDPAKKVVKTSIGEVGYDYLVLATGATTNFFGAKGASEYSYQLKDLEDAVHLKHHIIDSFEKASKMTDPEERKKLLSFAVVGGGPTGVELAAELAEFFYETFEKLYENILTKSEVKLYLINSGDRLLKQLPKKMGKDAERMLRKKGVTVISNVHATEVKKDGLVLDNGENVSSKNVIWVAGVIPSIPKVLEPFETSRSGRIAVNEHLQVHGYEEVYALGDVASYKQGEHELPMLAQVAVRQAKVAAENIIRSIHKRPLKTFKYRSLGSLVSVGRWYAVGDILGFKVSGWDVWVVWRVVYWSKFASAAKRLKILNDWVIDFFFPRDIAKRH